MLTATALKFTGMMLTLPTINLIANRFGTESTGAKIAIITVGLIGIVLTLDLSIGAMVFLKANGLLMLN